MNSRVRNVQKNKSSERDKMKSCIFLTICTGFLEIRLLQQQDEIFFLVAFVFPDLMSRN
jgi:hypothetical protein